jgi:hypothetical protein
MSKVRTGYVFPRTHTTAQKINITSLTLALSAVSKDEDMTHAAARMVESLYSKSQDRAFKRADAILAVLKSHG